MICSATRDDTLKEQVAVLFHEHHAGIYAYLVRMVRDREWANDLTQEAFLKVYAARDDLPHIENARAWTYRIATNLALNAMRRRRRFTWLPWQAGQDAPQASRPDPAERVDRHDAIEAALDTLTPAYRAPLLLYSHYGFSVSEVAEALGIREGAVKTRLYRAREMFRKAYEGEVK